MAADESGDNTNVVGSPVQFSWQAMQGGNSHRLQISQTNASTAETCTNGCVGCVYNIAASSTSRSVVLGAGTYYCAYAPATRIKAGLGAWCERSRGSDEVELSSI